MAIALESALDLVLLLLWAVAWGLLSLMAVLIATGKAHLNPHFPLIGRPLDPVWNVAGEVVGSALHTAARGAEKSWSGLLNGLQLAFALLILTIALPVIGARKAFEYLWAKGIPAKLLQVFVTGMPTVAAAKGLAHFVRTVVNEFSFPTLKDITDAATGAYTSAVTYVDTETRTLRTTLRGDIQTAKGEAQAYADAAVKTLRTAEDTAISAASVIAHAAQTAADAATAELATVENLSISAAIATAEAEAAGLLAASEAAATTALDAVKAIAITAERDATALEQYLADLDLAKLVTSVPAIATIVTAIAVEAGLENAECRGKVKQICRTDANVWTALLGGAVAFGFAFDFADVVRAGVEVEHLAASLLSKLGTVAEHDIQKAGRAVGEAAKAIAA